jgi:Fe-S-cluster-containing hydrogenase component 2
MCGECWKFCPAKAITEAKKKLLFDYDKCIRCYCCIEVCPHGALKAKEPVIGKLVRRVYRK